MMKCIKDCSVLRMNTDLRMCVNLTRHCSIYYASIYAADKRGGHSESDRITDKEVITRMFNDFGNWEHTPDGIVPVRHNKNTKDI